MLQAVHMLLEQRGSETCLYLWRTYTIGNADSAIYLGAIASSSYLTELVRGMTLEDAGKIRNTEIARELCLPPVKCKSSGLTA